MDNKTLQLYRDTLEHAEAEAKKWTERAASCRAEITTEEDRRDAKAKGRKTPAG